MKNTKFNKVTKIITKILEVTHWVGTALLIAAGVCALAFPEGLKCLVDFGENATIDSYTFEASVLGADGTIHAGAFAVYAFGAAIAMILVAMIFRNLNLIVKKSEEESHFAKDNVRMMKEIGIFSIAIPVVTLITSIIFRIVIGVDTAEIVMNGEGIIMGIIVLCLTQFFARGAELEEEVDGLL